MNKTNTNTHTNTWTHPHTLALEKHTGTTNLKTEGIENFSKIDNEWIDKHTDTHSHK